MSYYDMVRYKMLGRDVNSFPIQYRTWVVNDQPDFTGQQYTGLKSGPDPLLDVVAFDIANPSLVADFNLPDPLRWDTTKKVLPSPLYDSQLAVIDGYVYLFGGLADGYQDGYDGYLDGYDGYRGIFDGYAPDGYNEVGRIYFANLNNPADWFDSGFTLPGPVTGSKLAVIDGYMYLFGGQIDRTPTNIIFSAHTSNPLVWIDTGHQLPQNVSHAQLGVTDGYLYLFGGQGPGGTATSNIMVAPTSNPLAWSVSSAHLPEALYASQIALINGNFYLFGGLLLSNNPTSAIYTAPLSNPLSWTKTSATLPYASFYSQFVTVGANGYLFGPTTSGSGFTNILRCTLDNPLKWIDTAMVIPGVISQSQLAIIYDRLWLFGGNGSSIIFATNLLLKFGLYSSPAINYGVITRTLYQAVTNPLDRYAVLGFPAWKANYTPHS